MTEQFFFSCLGGCYLVQVVLLCWIIEHRWIKRREQLARAAQRHREHLHDYYCTAEAERLYRANTDK